LRELRQATAAPPTVPLRTSSERVDRGPVNPPDQIGSAFDDLFSPILLEVKRCWSENVNPIAGTDSCQAPHLCYMVSGRMRVVMDDGTEGEAGPGDVIAIAPAHDPEIIGVETCIFLDFSGFESYAKEG
jgi:hypothetical protein